MRAAKTLEKLGGCACSSELGPIAPTINIELASTRDTLFSRFAKLQRRRPACASAQSDQRLCYSHFGKNNILTCFKRFFDFLELVSVAEETDYSLDLAETTKTGFIASRPKIILQKLAVMQKKGQTKFNFLTFAFR